MLDKLGLIRLVWTICFAIGAFNHARDIWNHGWLPYTFAPLPFNIYWTALLPLDLSAALLIWLRPRAGAWLGVAIMVSDVAINSWIVFGTGFGAMSSALAMQSAFLLFVLATFRQLVEADGRNIMNEDKGWVAP